MFIGTLITMALGLVLWIPYGPGHPDLQNVGMENLLLCIYKQSVLEIKQNMTRPDAGTGQSCGY